MRTIYLLICLCLASSFAEARGWSLAGRAAYFYPQDSLMRDIYGDGWPDYEIEAEYAFTQKFSCFSNLSYYHKCGESTCIGYSTTVDHFAFNAGFKRYLRCNPCYSPYFGLGLGVARVHFHDKSPFVRQHTRKTGFSVLAKSGIDFRIAKCWYLDAFLDYNFNTFSFDSYEGTTRNDVQTGGPKIGLGIKYLL
jgi:opacity protein-like surface antigen